MIDHLAEDEPHALAIARTIIRSLPLPQRTWSAASPHLPTWQEPLAPPLELRSIMHAGGTPNAEDILARVLDGSQL